ncbi:GIY-YIG endonuclease [Haloarcula virus HVTV-2]|uniref:GIY-YIG domain-containing protein n=1 Tax=Haloarcula vallismortis tailed virus 1 TaxID=1262528 RepID=L7TK97_9CAUD|nr:hypothetical protein HVTV1_35 [Haloarcula vallismortis tailed virus 1]YP_008059078.1 hypothetical protein M200_gp036 [Halovirus HCTV-5]AGC34405.1 hypothetical protein HVTV1_35 [Haloarcula vallismortis tailed virus 1]AGM11646.1 hypothetical protein HCTV5_36 [Halovirus HCTV-5]UBF22842.1 GIY-YIG endonuclease [Haloarcula virus HVTV-2]
MNLDTLDPQKYWEHDSYDFSTSGYVYVLVLKRSTDDTTWFYVGETTQLEKRLRVHSNCASEMTVSVQKDGDSFLERIYLNEDDRFDVVGLYDLVPVEGGVNQRKDAERKRAYEIAIEHETTNILGGH